MHQSRIERAPGADGVLPDMDAVTAVAALAAASDATAIASPIGGVAPAGSGCFNSGVARMLTHWKEN